jgi:WD40 repeat protein
VIGRYDGKHGAAVNGLAVHGTIAATGGSDGSLLIWDLSRPGELRELRSLRGHDKVVDRLSFSPDGTRLISLSSQRDDAGFAVWDPATGNQLRSWPHPRGETFTGAVCVDARRAVVSTARSLAVMDLEHGTSSPRPQSAHVGPIAIHETTVAACEEQRVLLLPLDDLGASSPDRVAFEEPQTIFSAVALDREQVAAGSADGRVWLRSRTDATSRAYRSHSAPVVGVALLPGRRVLSCSEDGSLAITDLEARRVMTRLLGHTDAVHAVALISRDEAISTSKDGTVRRWDLVKSALATPAAPADTHGAAVLDLAAAGERVVSASRDGTVREWSADGKPSRIDRVELDWPNRISVSHGGRRVLIGCQSGAVRLVEGEKAIVLSPSKEAPASRVLSVWSNEGRYARTGTLRRVEVWDLEQHVNVPPTYPVPECNVFAIAQPPGDPTTFFAGGDSSESKIYPLAVSANDRPEGFPAGASHVSRLAFLGSDFLLAATNGNPAFRATRFTSGMPIGAETDTYASEALALACAADGTLAAVGHQDGRIALFRPAGEKLELVDELSIAKSDDRPLALAFSEDRRTLWAGTGRGVILVFKVAAR